jgi:hypothetical protein
MPARCERNKARHMFIQWLMAGDEVENAPGRQREGEKTESGHVAVGEYRLLHAGRY